MRRPRTEVSAVLVKLKDPASGFQMDMLYNKRGNRLTFAWPIGAMLAKLFDRVAWVDHVLGFICYLVVVVATASILASIYNSMNERRREIAILRALGRAALTVFRRSRRSNPPRSQRIGMVLAFVDLCA